MRDSPAFRLGRPGGEAEQKQLWRAVFGDSDAYIDAFYGNLYAPERMALAVAGEAPVGMCVLLPVRLCLPDGSEHRAAYLYALAVDQACRGRGIAHDLLAFADRHLQADGYAAVCTVPAEPSLHRFFASAGYREAFTLHAAEYAAADLPPAPPRGALRQIDPDAYRALREPLLAGRAHVAYDAAFYAHLHAVCRLSGGGLYHVDTGGAAGLAAVEYDEDFPVIKELLIGPAEVSRACALVAAHLRAARLAVRTPPGTGEPVPFGMLRRYLDFPAPDAGYLAFALD